MRQRMQRRAYLKLRKRMLTARAARPEPVKVKVEAKPEPIQRITKSKPAPVLTPVPFVPWKDPVTRLMELSARIPTNVRVERSYMGSSLGNGGAYRVVTR